jgi:undecaprenyl-diphosphatase
LLPSVALLLLILAVSWLASEVAEGGTQHFDQRVLTSLRDPADLSRPIGPHWLVGAVLDITALGSSTVLGLIVATIAGFLLLQGRWRIAAFIASASVGAWLLTEGLKLIVQRPRPTVVPHLRDVTALSFPSGHAMTSAAVYLTLGALLTRVVERRLTKAYCFAVAVLLTVLVGASRVYLGVHYPTDVVAGWLIGVSWALGCWLVERALERGTGLSRERTEAR